MRNIFDPRRILFVYLFMHLSIYLFMFCDLKTLLSYFSILPPASVRLGDIHQRVDSMLSNVTKMGAPDITRGNAGMQSYVRQGEAYLLLHCSPSMCARSLPFLVFSLQTPHCY